MPGSGSPIRGRPRARTPTRQRSSSSSSGSRSPSPRSRRRSLSPRRDDAAGDSERRRSRSRSPRPRSGSTKAGILKIMEQVMKESSKLSILRDYLKDVLQKAELDINLLPQTDRMRNDFIQGCSDLLVAHAVHSTPPLQPGAPQIVGMARLFQNEKDEWMNHAISIESDNDFMEWLNKPPPIDPSLNVGAATPRVPPPHLVHTAPLYSQPTSQPVPFGVIYSNIRDRLISRDQRFASVLPKELPYGNTIEFDLTASKEMYDEIASRINPVIEQADIIVRNIISATMNVGRVAAIICGVVVKGAVLAVVAFVQSIASSKIPSWLLGSAVHMMTFAPRVGPSTQSAYDDKYKILFCLITTKLVYSLGLITHSGREIHIIIEKGFELLNRYLHVYQSLSQGEKRRVDGIMEELKYLTQWYLIRVNIMVESLMSSVPGRRGSFSEIADRIPISHMTRDQIRAMGDTTMIESEPDSDPEIESIAQDWNRMTSEQREARIESVSERLNLSPEELKAQIRVIRSQGAALQPAPAITGTDGGGGKKRKTKRHKSKRHKSKKRKSKKRKSKKRKTKRKSKRR